MAKNKKPVFPTEPFEMQFQTIIDDYQHTWKVVAPGEEMQKIVNSFLKLFRDNGVDAKLEHSEVDMIEKVKEEEEEMKKKLKEWRKEMKKQEKKKDE